MAADGAPLTEDDVRERLNLRSQSLADVRSLSLPGTYHEKISHLGNSLKNFVRLKSLDLSRNALTTLEGLQHLTCLEKLNLYFNHISSLSEVFRLHCLTELKDVDLRLNPVVKNESDYRLFVVHMLPNLRQLDDRPVRDSERNAALLHFSTDAACKFKKPSIVTRETETEGSVHPRVEYINSLSRKCLLMDEDDEAVLNLIAKCEWDFKKPLGITGSAKVEPKVELYGLNSICKIEDNTKQHWKSESLSPRLILVQKWKKENVPTGSQIQNRIVLKATETEKAPPRTKEPVGRSWKMTEPGWKIPEPKIISKDSIPQESNQLPPGPMEQLLDLVDKYWNGRKSLHCNEAFLSQAENVLTAIENKSLPTDQQKGFSEQKELNNVLLEKEALEKRLSEQTAEYSAKITSLTSDLDNTKKEMDNLKVQLNKLLEENRVVQPKQEQNVQGGNTADSASSDIKKLENQNKLLTDENANLKQRLQQLDKIQDLTEMLQGSHRTLVSTNERLLKELEELRSRHKTEVEQLQWNYNQLKKTVDTLPPDDKTKLDSKSPGDVK